MTPKNIIIFGSTGSIGKSCLEVISRFPHRFKVVGLSAKDNFRMLAEQAEKFGVPAVVIGNPIYYNDLKSLLSSGISVSAGIENIPSLLESAPPVHLVVNAMVGAAGLIPTIKTLEKGITLALANKESLVAAGRIVLKTARQYNVRLLPIDSEHSAIFQCLLGEDSAKIDRLILTASGGPFLDTPYEDFQNITPQRALKHPNWEMGSRITIDSATMANKGFEVIEAHWLFDIPPDRIEVVIHRQSIVHSMVRFSDGSYIAQMGTPDMRLPIQFALTYPERLSSPYCRLDFNLPFSLDFQPVPEDKFPCLGLAYEALGKGGLAPAALNAADETAVSAFLRGKIGLKRIPELIAEALKQVPENPEPSIEEILDADREARLFVDSLINVH